METVTIQKEITGLGWKFSFEHGLPTDFADAVVEWGEARLYNHAHNAVVIALRARAEALVKKYVREELGVDNKSATASWYASVQSGVVGRAIARMQIIMPAEAVPLGERTATDVVAVATRAADRLTDKQLVALMVARGIQVIEAKAVDGTDVVSETDVVPGKPGKAGKGKK